MVSYVFYFILIAGIMASTVMILFSHQVSKICKLEFNEAPLLNNFINGTKGLPEVNNENAIWGWLIHYSIGIIVAAWMYYIIRNFDWETIISNGALLGLVAGIVGAVGWTGLFTLHPKPPHTDLKEFLLQFLIAHCSFGATATLVLGMIG